jgi:hypothetical protein
MKRQRTHARGVQKATALGLTSMLLWCAPGAGFLFSISEQ